MLHHEIGSQIANAPLLCHRSPWVSCVRWRDKVISYSWIQWKSCIDMLCIKQSNDKFTPTCSFLITCHHMFVLNMLCNQSAHVHTWVGVLGHNWFSLTHWDREKMAAISQMTFWNGFSLMEMYELRLKFHWSLFLGTQLTIFQHWLRWWLGADQATSHYQIQWWLGYWRIYASLCVN